MIRYRLRERISDREFAEGRRITLEEVASETGISRPTLTRITSQRGYSTSVDVLARLCEYFHCDIGDLVQFVPEKEAGAFDHDLPDKRRSLLGNKNKK